jgi:hypothetical protein
MGPEHTANEGPVRIQYECLVPIYVFPEIHLLFPKQNYNVLSPNSYTHISMGNLYISRIRLPILLQEICGLILGIYKSLTDTCINVEIGTEAAQFPEKEYIYVISFAVHRTCSIEKVLLRAHKSPLSKYVLQGVWFLLEEQNRG